jgi:crotonobetaine/carnitine-CoA ligase
MGRVRRLRSAVIDDENLVPTARRAALLMPTGHACGRLFRMPDRTVEAWRNLWFPAATGWCARPTDLFASSTYQDVIRRRGASRRSRSRRRSPRTGGGRLAVFPVPSDLAEDEVMAAVVLRPGAALAPAALLDHCRARIAYFAVPRYVDFVPALPTTENGKVQKFRLREAGITATTWDREAAGYRLRP